jgi:hypothetical protein
MKYAIIENGKVANIAVADRALESNWVPGEGAAIGDLYQDGQFIPSPPDIEAMARLARLQRNALLADCDWVVLKAAEVGAVTDPGWIIYRQALREVPQQAEFPLTIMWPVQPGA